jgi:hypothetical protein
MDRLVLILVTVDITLAAAALIYMVWGMRKIIEITRAGDAAIFLQGRRIEEVLRAMQEELQRA